MGLLSDYAGDVGGAPGLFGYSAAPDLSASMGQASLIPPMSSTTANLAQGQFPASDPSAGLLSAPMAAPPQPQMAGPQTSAASQSPAWGSQAWRQNLLGRMAQIGGDPNAGVQAPALPTQYAQAPQLGGGQGSPIPGQRFGQLGIQPVQHGLAALSSFNGG